MSVEQWKRVITIAVLAILLCLVLTVIVLGVKLHNARNAFDKDTLINLEDYDGVSTEESQRLLAFLNRAGEETAPSYQEQYPELYVENDFQYTGTAEKVCYLTFDDGPTPSVTTTILDVLKKNKVKATFFVIGKEGEAYKRIYQRIVEEGHTIAVHTYSHDYESVYQSVESFLRDFDAMSHLIEEYTGVKPEIFRFPGGSVNAYNKGIYQEIIAEMIRRGYTYYDWNVSSEDAVDDLSATEILRNVAYAADEKEDDIIVLMHDGEGRETTAEALPAVITELRRQGYSFDRLDKEVKPICFEY